MAYEFTLRLLEGHVRKLLGAISIAEWRWVLVTCTRADSERDAMRTELHAGRAGDPPPGWVPAELQGKCAAALSAGGVPVLVVDATQEQPACFIDSATFSDAVRWRSYARAAAAVYNYFGAEYRDLGGLYTILRRLLQHGGYLRDEDSASSASKWLWAIVVNASAATAPAAPVILMLRGSCERLDLSAEISRLPLPDARAPAIRPNGGFTLIAIDGSRAAVDRSDAFSSQREWAAFVWDMFFRAALLRLPAGAN